MKRRIQGLRETTPNTENDVPVYLVRVDRAKYRWHQRKQFYALRLFVLEPRELAGRAVFGRLYCSTRAVWKLAWFLRDFLYDPELWSPGEVDDKALSGLSRGGHDQPYHCPWHSPTQPRRLCPGQPVGGIVVSVDRWKWQT